MKVTLALGACLALCGPSSAGDRPVTACPFPSPRHSGEGRIAFSASNVQLLGWKPLSEFGASTSGSDCWGYTSSSGREYAIIGVTNGTGFVEVTDPGNPVIVAFMGGPSSNWRGVKTYLGRAYVVSEGGSGIQVFDLRDIDTGVVTHVRDVAGATCSNATHTVAIDEVSGFLYRCGGGACLGMSIYSLAAPSNPSLVGSWNGGRYVHECQVVTWTQPGIYQGKQIAFCFTELHSSGTNPRLQILDVTNKNAITEISTTAYPGGVFSHQGWISAGQQHLYLNDEKDDGTFGGARTRMFGISDLAAPSYLGFFSSGAASVDHNLYVRGNRIYEGNYRSGLHVFDNTVPTAPVQIGFFDTFPADDAQETDGLWSNYPFFASGTIVGGDQQKGLFVWREGAPELTFEFPNGLPERVDPGGQVLRFEVVENTPGDLQTGTVKFHYSTGGPFTTVDATFLGGRLYEAAVPALTCGQTLDFYLSAQSLSQITWSEPPAGPTQIHRVLAAYGETVEHEDTLEADSGWGVDLPDDVSEFFATASSGNWIRGNPIGSGAQPEDDHTPDSGTMCFFTGNGSVGGPLGEADIDGGVTALRSPVLDASGMNDPHLSYWRWFSNTGGGTVDDRMQVHISNDGGATWVPLETLGPVDDDSGGGWIRHEVRIADYLVPTNAMCVRFRPYDFGAASIVEAAVDDLRITDIDCTLPPLSIGSVSPSEGSFNGGNLVTLRGTGFQAGVTGVLFGGRAAQSVAVLDSTTIEARVPRTSGPASGKTRRPAVQVDVTVQNPGSDSLPAGYTYAPELR